MRKALCLRMAPAIALGEELMATVFQQTITGMDLSTLVEVLLRHRCRVSIRYLPRVAYLFGMAIFNSYVKLLEQATNGQGIAAAELVAPPIFVLGTWRSGTTHLHNLLSCDPTLTCPSAYQVMFPHHFVYSHPWGSKIFNSLTPGKRPMDNVAIDGGTPHEDELALAALSGVSPYLRNLFPVSADGYSALNPDHLPPEALAEWQAALRLFLKKLSFSKNKRIVLKSPPHLGRVAVLLKMFPGAKFVHIVRNPYVVYLSAKKLWHSGLALSHLQKPDPQVVDEIILSWYSEVFDLFERDRELIPPGDLHELRFEDLEKSPQECLAKLYQELSLPGFERFWQQASAYLKSVADYKKNSHTLTEEIRVKVSQRWRSSFERYNYPLLSPIAPGATIVFGQGNTSSRKGPV